MTGGSPLWMVDEGLHPWGLRGAEDFADAAWRAGEVLGNIPGVTHLSVDRSDDGDDDRPRVIVYVDNPGYLRRMANEHPLLTTGTLRDGVCPSWRGEVNGIVLTIYVDDEVWAS